MASTSLAECWRLVGTLGVDPQLGPAWSRGCGGHVQRAGGTGLAAVTQDFAFPAPEPEATEMGAIRPPNLWLALYAGSGFCALSLEMLWFRMTDVAVKSTAFTFGTVLSAYLLGLATGSLFGIPFARRLREPLRGFLVCQCLILLYSGAVLVALTQMPQDGVLAWYASYWAQPQGFRLGAAPDRATLVRLYMVIPAILFGPATVLMGLSFPVLQRAVQNDPRTSGYKVGCCRPPT
jgi:spermidine synthase